MKRILNIFALLLTIGVTAQHYTPLSYSFNGTPKNGIKIKTNLPYISSSQMPTVIIEGYNYGKGKSIGVMLNWYIYQGNFISYGASSHGAYTPPIKLANEGGKVIIFLDSREYFNRFQVRVFAKGLGQDDIAANYENWTTADEAVSGTNVVNVPYNNPSLQGDVNIDGIINVTTNNDAVLNFNNTDNSWQYMQFKQSGSRKAYVGLNSSNDFVVGKEKGGDIALLGANVGVGTNTPGSKIDIRGKERESFRLFKEGLTDKYLSMWHGSVGAVIEPIRTNGSVSSLFVGGYDNRTNVFIASRKEGNVGIGTINTNAKLTLNNKSNQEKILQFGADGPTHWFMGIGNNAGDYFHLGDNDEKYIVIRKHSGDVGIGTLTTGGHKLAVDGSIGAREIKVESRTWPDYVFTKEYTLPTLKEVEKHINEKGHLPNIPSAKEVKKNKGIELGEMNRKLLEKVEELTLYTIQQEKQLVTHKKEIENSKTVNKQLLNVIEKLEKRIEKLENK
ncbi:hypothetical protein [Tenacibaculum sp. 190524A02b]|uniref:hypothetical protein n=1 Tax=Tenacibaculum vairaonense TaxID=3137860 RepID=UPI0031FA7787